MADETISAEEVVLLNERIEKLERLLAEKSVSNKRLEDFDDRLHDFDHEQYRTLVRVRIILAVVLIGFLVVVPLITWAPYFFLLFLAIVA